MNDSGDAGRDRLLAHWDHRAVRAVFEVYTGTGTGTGTGIASIDRVDWAEAMCATDGELALLAQDGVADVYVRWNGATSRFEHLSLSPPWTLVGYDHADRAAVETLFAGATNVRPVAHGEPPFAAPGTLALLGDPRY